MYFESKILNVQLKRTKVHYIPDVFFADVPTFETSNEQLKMDILIPQSNKPLPAVIFVTGGGFVSANRARCPQLRMRLAESGYFVASINYRTVPNSLFPHPIEDVKSAIRFLKANAQKFNVNPEKISLIGDSAGGYLVSFAAVTHEEKIFNVGDNLNQSSKIVAAVNLYGVSDLTKIAADYSEGRQNLHKLPSAMESLFLYGVPQFSGRIGTVFSDEKFAAAANPLNYVTENSAPMLLMHGTADGVVSPSQTDILFQVLKSKNVEAERYVIPNANHSDDFWIQDEVFDVIVNFLNNYSA